MVNPYLMASALLKAFDDGIARDLDPGEPRAAQYLRSDRRRKAGEGSTEIAG